MRSISGRIKISIVGYTNTLPFRWALKRSELFKRIALHEDHPGECARKLQAGEVDLALIPVAVIPQLKSHHVVSDYCIGADGIVDSVKLYSEVLPAQIEEVLLDYQSRTSVMLARIILSESWKLSPRFTDAKPGFETQITGSRAGVVIGDRTFALNGRFGFEFDLAEEWKILTGLPIVFAAWVSVRALPDEFVSEFNMVLAHGVKHIEQAVIEEQPIAGLNAETAIEYLTRRIDYHLDEKKKKAMTVFLEYFKGLDH